MPCTQWAISAVEILSLRIAIHQWQSQGQIKTPVSWSLGWNITDAHLVCLMKSPVGLNPSFLWWQSVYKLYFFSGLSPCLFISVLCSFYCISYNHFSDKQLGQILNSESISRKVQSDTYYQRFFFIIIILFWNIHYNNDHTVFN